MLILLITLTVCATYIRLVRSYQNKNSRPALILALCSLGLTLLIGSQYFLETPIEQDANQMFTWLLITNSILLFLLLLPFLKKQQLLNTKSQHPHS